MRRPKKSRKPAAAKAAGVAAPVGLALAAAWRRARRKGLPGTDAAAASGMGEDAPAAMRDWTCECGQRFRVSGEDRHRVFWTDGAEDGDPVMGDACPNCERSLSEQEAAA